MVAGGTASDGGGSIRIPAACCGLLGMKPTRDRTSGAGGSQNWLGLSVNGALARTVADSALLLEVMSSEPYVEAAQRDPGRLRIAVSRKVPPGLIAKLSDDQRGAWEGTRDLLAELGHEVTERDPAYGTAGIEFIQTWLRGIYEESLDVPDPSQLERSTRQMAALGHRLVPDRRREKLLGRRERLAGRILDLWEEVDVLLTPAITRTALPADGAYGRPAPVAIDRAGRFTPWTPPFNFTGQPACSVPAGFGSDGLPLSVQLVGRRGAEDVLYSLAGQLEAARPWAGYRPTFATNGGPPE
jgi:amidase